MITITIDDDMINALIAVGHYENAQEAVISILSNYLQQQKKELPLFERLRFIDDESAEDDIASLFERDKCIGRDINLLPTVNDQSTIKPELNQKPTLEQMLETFDPELHGGEFPLLPQAN